MVLETATTFETVVARLFTRAGWQVSLAPADTKDYDLEARRNKEVVAIQARNYKTAVKVSQLEKFLDFLDQPQGKRFTRGVFLTASGFSRATLTYFDQVQSQQQSQQRIRLGTFRNGKFDWVNADAEDMAPPRTDPLYIGIFTCKGGVGKTTVSAHLAGAFALCDYDVALVDLDPQQNLATLLGDGIQVPGRRDRTHRLKIYNRAQWDAQWETQRDEAEERPQEKVLVCDCSPVLSENPRSLIEKFSYCIIPTTLNPLGLNKNGHVIKQTLEAIRAINKDAYLFVLINNHFEDETTRGLILKEQYYYFFNDLAARDQRFKFIDPDEVAIRNSKQLFYWGYHIYSGDPYQLAFNPVGGRCLPKADFLNLLNYLEEHSEIAELRGDF